MKHLPLRSAARESSYCSQCAARQDLFLAERCATRASVLFSVLPVDRLVSVAPGEALAAALLLEAFLTAVRAPGAIAAVQSGSLR